MISFLGQINRFGARILGGAARKRRSQRRSLVPTQSISSLEDRRLMSGTVSTQGGSGYAAVTVRNFTQVTDENLTIYTSGGNHILRLSEGTWTVSGTLNTWASIGNGGKDLIIDASHPGENGVTIDVDDDATANGIGLDVNLGTPSLSLGGTSAADYLDVLSFGDVDVVTLPAGASANIERLNGGWNNFAVNGLLNVGYYEITAVDTFGDIHHGGGFTLGAAGSISASMNFTNSSFKFQGDMVASHIHPTLRFFGQTSPTAAPFQQLDSGSVSVTRLTNMIKASLNISDISDITVQFGNGTDPFLLLDESTFDDGTTDMIGNQNYLPLPGSNPIMKILKNGVPVAEGVFTGINIQTYTDGYSNVEDGQFRITKPLGTDSRIYQAIMDYTGGTGRVNFSTDYFEFSGTPTGSGDAARFDLLGDSQDVISPGDDLIGRHGTNGKWYVAKSDWLDPYALNLGDRFTNVDYGTWDPSVNLSFVVRGDFDGDGRTDIAGRNANNGQLYVGLNDGNAFATSVWGSWAAGYTWDDVQVGDFDGDGRDDVAGYVKSQGRWYIGRSTGSGFTTSTWLQTTPGMNIGDVHVGDFNADGRVDISMRNVNNGQVAVLRSLGTSFASSIWMTQSTAYNWDFQQVGDFDGDGRTDIASFVASQNRWYVSRSTGSTFVTTSWRTLGATTWGDAQAGDFNGDGRTDLLFRDQANGKLYVLNSLGSSFGATQWGTWSTSFTWGDIQVGDFDGDGRADLATRVTSVGKWFVARSNGNSFTTTQWGVWPTSVNWINIGSGGFIDSISI